MKRLLYLLLFIAITSCSLDNQFLQPSKLDPKTKEVKTRTRSITFSKDNKQPVFFDSRGDSIHLGYKIESIFFKSSNGNDLNGWFLKPENIKPKVTLLHLHGNAGCLFTQYKLIDPFVKKGYQVFMFDYSGFGFSQGKATRSNVKKDGLSALNYLLTRPEVMDTKIVVYGQSLGGHLAAVVASLKQEKVDALVIEGAFSSHKDIAYETAGFLGKMIVREKYSAKEAIKSFKKPVIIIHSKDDKIIPLTLSNTLFENANEPKFFLEIENDHLYGPTFHLNRILERIESVL